MLSNRDYALYFWYTISAVVGVSAAVNIIARVICWSRYVSGTRNTLIADYEMLLDHGVIRLDRPFWDSTRHLRFWRRQSAKCHTHNLSSSNVRHFSIRRPSATFTSSHST